MSPGPVVEPGPFGDPAAVDRLVADRVASRIAARDHTLWGADAEDEAARRLGWVTLPETSRPLLAELDALAADLRAEGLDRVVLCGMGGSSLAPEVITRSAGVPLVVLDSTEPAVVARGLSDLGRTVVVVSSKSGTTVETDSQRRVFEAAFADADIDPGPRFVAVTDPGSPLADLADERGWRRTFLADPAVGGRFSALSAFGLVPSALAGAQLGPLLDEAAAAAAAVGRDEPDNPALLLAAALAGAGRRDKVALVGSTAPLAGFGDWAEQLLAESTGKHGTGLLPVVVEGPDAPEARWPADDVTVARVRADDGEAPARAAVTVTGPLGAQLLLWETAVAVAGRLLGINPFDQPDVEAAKLAARALLDGAPEEPPPTLIDGPVEVRGDAELVAGATSLDDAVGSLLARIGPRGYLAVMAYLDPQQDGALAEVRAPLARRTERPTTLGWGPRFLHSTGQYHKGGPPTGVFCQLTAAPITDLEVPDRPFSFGRLIAAQAAGDAAVLAERGRPVLRLHLTDRAAGLRSVLAALR